MLQALMNFYLRPFYQWRSKHLSNKKFMIALAIFVGLVSGLAAVLLKNFVGYVEHYVGVIFTEDRTNFWYLILPLIGVVLTVLVIKRILKEDVGHGVSKVLWTIAKGRGYLSSKKALSSVVGSAMTVGFGGSVGLEAPVVLAGASLGSKIGRIFKLDYTSLMLLIGCGATGAISGIYNAPITGIIFTLEVLLLDLSMSSIVLLLVCSVTAAIVSATMLGRTLLFNFGLPFEYMMEHIPFYLMLGVMAGFVSVYFISAMPRRKAARSVLKILSKVKP